MVDFAPDSVEYALAMVAWSVAVWVGLELLLFDGSLLVAGISGSACGLAIVLVTRRLHGSSDEERGSARHEIAS